MLTNFRRTLRVSSIVLAIWVLIVFLATCYVFLLANGPHTDVDAAKQEYQPAYCIFIKLFFAPIIEIFGWITEHPGTITALATIFIGWFTWTLKRSTDKLWEEAKTSNAVTKQVADASTSQANTVAIEYIDSHIPRLIVRRVQLRCDATGHGIEFVLANIGESYAQDISGDLNIEVIPNSKSREFERNSIPLYSGTCRDISRMIKDAIPGHNEILQAGERQPIFVSSDKITDDILSRLSVRGEVLYFFGKIHYWNRTKTIEREMGFFRTYIFADDKWTFKAKEDDPDYEWN